MLGIENGVGGMIPQTDDMGQYRLRALMNLPVLFLHEKGWFESNSRILATNANVTLIPWGAVKGEYFIGTKPAQSHRLELVLRNGSSFMWRYFTTTDELGRFHFSRVPTGQVQVVSADRVNPDTSSFDPISERFNLKLGEIRHIQIKK